MVWESVDSEPLQTPFLCRVKLNGKDHEEGQQDNGWAK